MKTALLQLSLILLSAQSLAADSEKSIFILAGQSNMAGRGGLENGEWDGNDRPRELRPNHSILRLNANLTWELAKEPLHADIDVSKPCGVGPGMPFAHQLLKKDSSLVPIGLVPCAIGGTNITDWRRGEKLYNNTMRRASAALKDGGTIRALLWYQGEQEADSGVGLGSFAKDVPIFFKAIRDDLNIPHLPIVQVSLPPIVNATLTREVRLIQKRMKLPYLVTVDGKGAMLQDRFHLNTQSQIKLGIKMAKAFLKLIHHKA